MQSRYQQLQHFLGLEPENISQAEKLVSTLGGFVSIFLIAYISFQFTGALGAALIVPSMGAAAVLLFAVPHGRLSQPWPLIGGNLISAVIGVSCYKFIPDVFVAAGLAVGLAIGAMHIFRCVHPPGGATALAAVIGGPAINAMGYQFVISPILLNVLVLLLVAVVFNSVFPWRRYPVSLMRFTDVPVSDAHAPASVVDKQVIEKALSDMDLIVDVTTDDLQRLFALTLEHVGQQKLSTDQVHLGHYYTNGRHGGDWSVRWIIDESVHPDPEKDMVIYRVVEGHGLRSANSCTRSEFAHWAAREVFPNKEQ